MLHNLRFTYKGEEFQLTEIKVIEQYPIWACVKWNEDTLAYEPSINKKPHILGKGFRLDQIIPLVRPLSDLTKEIEHNGERFVPVDKLDEINGFTFFGSIKNFYTVYEKGEYVPYWVAQKLYEWHFDFYLLLEKGLAKPL